jgi:MFS family permease
VAQTIPWFGDYFSYLALMWVVYHLTESEAATAGIVVTMTIPRLVFIVAGVYVDRLDRRRLMIAADGLCGLLTLLFIPAILTRPSGIVVTLAVTMLGVGAINALFLPYMLSEFGKNAAEVGLVDTAQAVGIRPIFVAAGLTTVGAAAMAAWAIEEPETGGWPP